MKKAFLATLAAFALATASLPSLADSDRSAIAPGPQTGAPGQMYHMQDRQQNECTLMMSQFDGAAPKHKGDAKFGQAQKLRDDGVAACDKGDFAMGNNRLRQALTMLGEFPAD